MSSRSLKITLQPDVLRWARERLRISQDELAQKMHVRPELVLEWEQSGRISVAQADRLAQRTHTPLGFLYLTEPPEDHLPIPDFRTRSDDTPPRPSPDLLETVETMLRRQAWMRDDLIEDDAAPLDFVGAYRIDTPPRQVAAAMRDALQLSYDWASQVSTWTDALKVLRDQAEDAGVMVVFNGIVGNNTRRKLAPDEFQGFALVDEYAPLIFVNSADFKAAQMFTFAHELAHLFVGETGVSIFQNLQPAPHATERFCNQTAAEFLVPKDDLNNFWHIAKQANDRYQAIARHFKVSSLVAARRTLDLNLIDQDEFFRFYQEYQDTEWHSRQQDQAGGGDFWNTQKWRIGPRFGTAIIRAVKEGRLLYREAYSLTGLKGETFESMPKKMGMLL